MNYRSALVFIRNADAMFTSMHRHREKVINAESTPRGQAGESRDCRRGRH